MTEQPAGRHQELIARLSRVAAEVLSEIDVELVELSLRGSSRKRILRVDIDREGPDGVTIDDCQRASKHLGAALDETDVLDGAYLLEVSSPGIERPIATPDDLRRNQGRRVRAEVREDNDQTLTVSGKLVTVDDGRIVVQPADGDPVEVAWDRVVQMRQEVDF